MNKGRAAGGEKHIWLRPLQKGREGPMRLEREPRRKVLMADSLELRGSSWLFCQGQEVGSRFKRTYESLYCTVTIIHVSKGREISTYSLPALCQAPQERGTFAWVS